MGIFSTTVLAFSMSADAFAAAVGKGTEMRKPCLRAALRTGAIFGAVETATPIAGWLLGLTAASYIAAIDHWIAFTILSIIGGKMLLESFSAKDEDPTAQPQGQKIGRLVLTAFATSIDAMAVGVTLAFLNINIIISALAIGAATFLMATIGVLGGHYVGQKAGRYAEALGGAALIIIGTIILLQHLEIG